MHPVDLVSLAPKNSSSMEEQSVIVTKLHPSCSRPLRVMLTGAPGHGLRKPKKESFKLKKILFRLLMT
jgi:hypothetical protein